MKLIYSENALRNLADIMRFYEDKIPETKIDAIINSILETADILMKSPFAGQKEPYLEHLNQDHRRLVEGNYKIIYMVFEKEILITDIFDARQDPAKMKG